MDHKPILETIPQNQLSQTDRAAIIRLCTQAFEEDYTPYLDAFENAHHILARQGEALVGHALWITRWLQVGTAPPLRTAYVEGVATDERFRGQGIATQIMTHLAAAISDFELGGLSPAETSLYTRLGWVDWKGPLCHRKGGLLIPDLADEALMILRLPKTPDLNLSQPISVEWRKGEIW